MTTHEKAQQAQKRLIDLRFLIDTKAWSDFEAARKREIEWAERESRSPEFFEKVMSNPAIYAKHVGYMEGLAFIDNYIRKVEEAGAKAVKDLEKHEQNR